MLFKDFQSELVEPISMYACMPTSHYVANIHMYSLFVGHDSYNLKNVYVWICACLLAFPKLERGVSTNVVTELCYGTA